jgi:hypothetical protein
VLLNDAEWGLGDLIDRDMDVLDRHHHGTSSPLSRVIIRWDWNRHPDDVAATPDAETSTTRMSARPGRAGPPAADSQITMVATERCSGCFDGPAIGFEPGPP